MARDYSSSSFGFRHCSVLQKNDKWNHPWAFVVSDRLSGPKWVIKVILDPIDDPQDVPYEVKAESALRKHVPRHIAPHPCEHQKLVITSPCFSQMPLRQWSPFIADEAHIIKSEYVNGKSVHHWLCSPNVSPRPLDEWRFILFGVIWSIAVLQESVGFMHNDLSSNNVLVAQIDHRTPDLEYQLGDKIFQVTSPRVCPILCDFEYSFLQKDPLLSQNPNCDNEDKLEIAKDIHTFLSTLLSRKICLPFAVIDFITSIYPPQVLQHAHDIAKCEEGNADVHFGETSVNESNESINIASTPSCDNSRTGSSRKDSTNPDSVLSVGQSVITHSFLSSARFADVNKIHDCPCYTSRDRAIDRTPALSSEEIKNEKDEYVNRYIYGYQLRHGLADEFKLPSPKEILCHPFFSVYLKR